MRKESEFLGSIGPEGIIDGPTDGEPKQETGIDGEHKESPDRSKEPVPVVITITQMGIALKRLQGVQVAEKKVVEMIDQLGLSNESSEDLKSRVEGTTENDWNTKPTYFTAVHRELVRRKITF